MSGLLRDMVDRRVLPVVIANCQEDPVVLLEGPRSVGKSTLLQQIAGTVNGRILDLDDPATRDAAARDPRTFVAGDEPVCIDEYQKVPALLDAIKAELNQRSTPGRFVLTGSTRDDALPSAAQAPTGRLSRIRGYPFSQGEIVDSQDSVLTTG